MKKNIDETLTRLTHSTHSPHGEHAATEATYHELLQRIPAEQRPVIVNKAPVRHIHFSHWSAAACVLLVVGIGAAIAGIVYQQFFSVQTETPAVIGAPATNQSQDSVLTYDKAPLSIIVADLCEVYHTTIQISNLALADYQLTATFSTHEELHEVLFILAEVGGFEVRTTEGGYVIE